MADSAPLVSEPATPEELGRPEAQTPEGLGADDLGEVPPEILGAAAPDEAKPPDTAKTRDRAREEPRRPPGETYEPKDFISFSALLSKRINQKRPTFQDINAIFRGLDPRNKADLTEKRTIIRKQRNDVFVKFVDKETLTKLLVQSGLMSSRTRLSSTWNKHHFIPNMLMGLASLCHGTLGRDYLSNALGSAMQFAVLLERVPYAKQQPKEARAQHIKHASFFGNYQAFDTTTKTTQEQFPYDALGLLNNPKENNAMKLTYTHRPWENTADGAKVAGVNFPKGQIQRNLVQFKDKKGKIPWSKVRVRGICAIHWSLTHGAAKHKKPGPLHIDVFCVAKQDVTQPVAGWAIQHGPLKYGGKRLMFEVLKYAKRLGIDWVELRTIGTADARCFYQSMGFRCLGKITDRERRLVGPTDLGVSEDQFENDKNFLFPEFQSRRAGAMIINLSEWNGKSLPVKWGPDDINWPIRMEAGACIQCIESQDAQAKEIKAADKAAETAADKAVEEARKAEAAAKTAEKAKEAAETAKKAEEAAAKKADEAAAEAAKTTTVQGKKTAAETAADKAKATAEKAKAAAQKAEAAVEKAKVAAENARRNANEAATAVEVAIAKALRVGGTAAAAKRTIEKMATTEAAAAEGEAAEREPARARSARIAERRARDERKARETEAAPEFI